MVFSSLFLQCKELLFEKFKPKLELILNLCGFFCNLEELTKIYKIRPGRRIWNMVGYGGCKGPGGMTALTNQLWC